MAITWKLLKQLRAPYTVTASTSLHRILPPRLLNLHNATRLFSNGPPLPPPSGEPPLIQLPQNPPSPSPSSLNQAELAKFATISGTWWDLEGPFKPLHAMNPTRLAFIRSTLCRHFRRDPLSARPFEGLRFIDVGCGGGILSEPLARMGAIVTGVDAVEKNIKIARLHADLDPVTSKIEYQCTTAEKLVEEQKSFDAVFALEVIEHVENPADFCKSLSALTVPSGATVISTINRSMRAYATAIIAAEYLLHWLPKGTHQWSNFLTPEELVLILERASISVQEMAGFAYNPLTGRWSISDDVGVNFIAYEHEMNCSAAAWHLASSGMDVYTALAGAVGALYGPLHGGANEPVFKVPTEIESVENIPEFIKGVKSRKQKMSGFGHRMYKNYDPRAKVI